MIKNYFTLTFWIVFLCLLVSDSYGYEIVLQIPQERENVTLHVNWTLLTNNSETYVIKNDKSTIGIQKISRNRSDFLDHDIGTIAKNYQLALQTQHELRQETINGREWFVQQYFAVQTPDNQDVRLLEYRYLNGYDNFVFFYLGPKQPNLRDINFFLSIPRLFPKINNTNGGIIRENHQDFFHFEDEINKVSYDVPSFWRESRDEKLNSRIWYPYSALNINYLPSITVLIKESYDRKYYKIGQEKEKLLRDNAKGFGTPSDSEIIVYKDAKYTTVDKYQTLQLSGMSYRYDTKEHSNFSMYYFNDGHNANTIVLKYKETFLDESEKVFARFISSYKVDDPLTFSEAITYNKKIISVLLIIAGIFVYAFYKLAGWLRNSIQN